MTSHEQSAPVQSSEHQHGYNPEPLLHPGMNLSSLMWLILLGLPVLLLFLIYARG